MFPSRSPWPSSFRSGGDWQDADERKVRVALDEGRLRAPALVREKAVLLEDLSPKEIVSCSQCGGMFSVQALPLESRRMPGKGARSGENVAGVFCPGCDHRLLSVESVQELADQAAPPEEREPEDSAGESDGQSDQGNESVERSA